MAQQDDNINSMKIVNESLSMMGGSYNMTEITPKSPESESPAMKRIKLEESKKKWTNEEVTRLIELFEERSVLWNVFDKDYGKRDKLDRDMAFMDISKELSTPVLDIKAKLNTLRAQMGRELRKVKKIKTGHAAEDFYQSSWVYWKRLQFLAPIMMQTAKTRQDVSVSSCAVVPEDNSRDFYEDELATMVSTTKSLSSDKSISEADESDILLNIQEQSNENRRISTDHAATLPSKLITSSPSSFTTELPKPSISHFTAYIDEKLSGLDKRNRLIAEKRISDILFDIEMNSTTAECSYSSCAHCPPSSHDGNSTHDVTTYPVYTPHG